MTLAVIIIVLGAIAAFEAYMYFKSVGIKINGDLEWLAETDNMMKRLDIMSGLSK